MSELAKVMKTFKWDSNEPRWTPAVKLTYEKEQKKCEESAIKLSEKLGLDAESEDGQALIATSSHTCLRKAIVMNPILA